MSLTGGPFVSVVIVVLVAVTLLAIVAHPRTKVVSFQTAQRAGFVVLAQLMAVLLTGVLVNNWGSFYGSWNDLLGGDKPLTTTDAGSGSQWSPRNGSRSLGTATSQSTGLTATSWSQPADYDTKGQIGSVTLDGPLSELSSEALVYLPPQYFQSKYSRSTFPVVQVFTGYPGAVRQIVNRIKYPEALLTAMKTSNPALPMILVFLNPTVTPPRDTECTNVPGGPQVATYFGQDVPNDLRQHLRVTPSGWGIMGHSTGGYCAIKLAMLAPKLFTTVVSLSGNYTAVRDGQTRDLWGGSTSFRNTNDPQWRMLHLPVPRIALLASVGSLERGSDGVASTQRFFTTIHPPFTGKLIVVKGGAHNFADYRRVLPQAYSWLSSHLTPGSAPAQ